MKSSNTHCLLQVNLKLENVQNYCGKDEDKADFLHIAEKVSKVSLFSRARDNNITIKKEKLLKGDP